ncbi:sensor histidine kinase [Paradevosia shaoguanensis]|uniref:sensor histidine kinase n=1 Tax=Paradevosia shaoguanensis TaxID=1335043 RepID=UPI001933DC10|nr:sensor histidine kinase KdpD [Paradevosia shaoguanensis]
MAIVEPARPTPEALLGEARKEGRGKLKVFLGAAPGVGKTFAMLQEADNRRAAGVDVVVGLVETHGRAETALLLEPLEQLPRRRLEYRGQMLDELDIDAVLARRPQLAIIDELAHTNVPGSRHLKRWQDVVEILDAGIDVTTTLNVQHIESLNDVVARITGVRVQETVPDEILRRADDIEIIDLPPEELIARLKAGKVYVPGNIGRALENFFTKGNLTALRELALRTAASRVDAEMLAYMQANAVRGPWPTQERLLVCINEAPISKTLVRAGKRMAERANIPWLVATVVTPRHEAMGEVAQRGIAEAMQLAESLGAETVTIHAESNAAGEILDLARHRNVTRIVIGRPRPRRFWHFLREAVADKLLDAATDFELTVVAGTSQAETPKLPHIDLSINWWGVVVGAAGAAVATGIAWAIQEVYPVPVASLAVIYLVGVLFVGARYGLRPALATSLISFLAYNFFFSEPLYTFTIRQVEDVVAIFLFLVGAIFTGTLAGRLRAQVQFMRASQRRTETLYDFARRIAEKTDPDDVLYAGAYHIAATLDCRSLILIPGEGGQLEQVQGYPSIEEHLDARAIGAAQWAFEHNEPAGAGTPTLPTSNWLFVPLATGKPLGVIGVQFRDARKSLDPETKRLLLAVEDQVAVAVERTRMAGDLENLRVQAEGEKLRSALLNSLSHDLRTPLVSVIGAISSLGEPGLRPEDRRALLETALDEARRLDRYVQNLLNMTRLEYGALAPRSTAVELREVVGAARHDLQRVLKGHSVRIDLPRDLPRVEADPVLLTQAIANVLENAAKYSPPGSEILISGSTKGGDVTLAVADAGPGIPAAEREKVFELFYRVTEGDRRPSGTGLGLAIVRGFVEAMGGKVRADENPTGQGAVISITLPLAAQPALPQEAE